MRNFVIDVCFLLWAIYHHKSKKICIGVKVNG